MGNCFDDHTTTPIQMTDVQYEKCEQKCEQKYNPKCNSKCNPKYIINYNTKNSKKLTTNITKIFFSLPTEQCTSANNIKPHLFTCSYNDASCLQLLQNLKIKHVINLELDTHGPWIIYKKNKISNKQIIFDPNNKQELNLIFNHILLCINNKENVLVHCLDGKTKVSQFITLFDIFVNLNTTRTSTHIEI